MVNIKIKFIMFSAVEDGEALYSQQKQSRELTVAQMVKNLPVMWETWVRSLGWEVPLEKDMATHSSILDWRSYMDRGAWWATIHRVAKSRT